MSWFAIKDGTRIHYQGRWAVVTGASSGLGRGLAARLADRGMSLVLTGRNEARLDETADQIRRARSAGEGRDRRRGPLDAVRVFPRCSITSATARSRCWSTTPGSAATARSPRPTRTARPRRWRSTSAPWSPWPARSCPECSPGGSGGILNVASTIAFQPAPYQAVYGASKAFVLSFSQALWAEARAAGVTVTALCPGPTRTGFVDALGADVGHTAIYSRLAEPEPVIEAGLRGWTRAGPSSSRRAEQGSPWRPVHAARVARPGLRPAAPPGRQARATDRVRNEIVIPRASGVGSVGRRRALAVVVRPAGGFDVESGLRGGRHTRSSSAAPWWPPSDRTSSLFADGRGVHAERTFTSAHPRRPG